MSALPEPNPPSELERLNAAADDAIEMAGGDPHSAIRMLILVNEYLEHELETNVSQGFTRGLRHGRSRSYNG
jgi:hypothetical protein